MTDLDASDTIWALVDDALAVAADAGRTIDVWLRDDDAVTTSPALDQLAAISRRFALPVLLAVIPAPADEALADALARMPLFTPAQHGFSHTNHAAPGDRACELGGARPLEAVLDELAAGRARMTALFGAESADVLVPPWNRIDPALLPHLPPLGFGALSTFANAHAGAPGLAVVNCQLDIIDWRRGRCGRPADQLATRLAALLRDGAPVGILSHHLAHDETAWAFLESAFDHLSKAPNVRFASFASMRAGSEPPGRPSTARRAIG